MNELFKEKGIRKIGRKIKNLDGWQLMPAVVTT